MSAEINHREHHQRYKQQSSSIVSREPGEKGNRYNRVG